MESYKMQSKITTIAKLRELSQQIPEEIPYLKMLVLFGSRATDNTHQNSDWDFAVIYDEELRNTHTQDNGFSLFELPMLIGKLFNINPDNVDVVELNRCSNLIAHFIARDGKVLYENESNQFEKFRQRVLLDNSEIKRIEGNKRQSIEQFLERWGV